MFTLKVTTKSHSPNCNSWAMREIIFNFCVLGCRPGKDCSSGYSLSSSNKHVQLNNVRKKYFDKVNIFFVAFDFDERWASCIIFFLFCIMSFSKQMLQKFIHSFKENTYEKWNFAVATLWAIEYFIQILLAWLKGMKMLNLRLSTYTCFFMTGSST